MAHQNFPSRTDTGTGHCLPPSYKAGRHFLQIPGPTNVPDRILRAIDRPTIDHRGREFARLGRECLEGMKQIFNTANGEVFIFPASGTGAWEAAIVNTLSAGDHVLLFETGHFAVLWGQLAEKFGLIVDFVPGDWRHGIDTHVVAARLSSDRDRAIKAVMCVHNETSTGVTSDIAAVRKAMDAEKHPALLMVDTVSSLASIDYRHEEWGVDVTIAGSQKGLMLPPGLGFNAVSPKALAASQKTGLPRAFWSWEEMQGPNANGYFPSTPATNLLYGLREAISMLLEEGLEQVFQRHLRLSEATRRAVGGWGLELLCLNPTEYSASCTAILMPDGFDEAQFRVLVLDYYNLSLGAGLGKFAGRVFRIGHLGDLNDLMLCGTLCGIEMGLARFGVPHHPCGVSAAMKYLAE
ncbi:MAG: aminotransferase class V-fold PLP-dependent enzyme [Verrucomicrobia bacterium]|nr:aminotransferase class V-fold PLP-dependent enzyme [Verrucomicrobiota bacterium]